VPRQSKGRVTFLSGSSCHGPQTDTCPVRANKHRGRLRRLVLGSITLLCALAGTRGTQDAVANGDTRTIAIQHMHTKELTTVTYRRDGRYDSAALEKLNWALRDWRLDEPTKMDPRLFDLAWEVHRAVGSSEPIHVVSAYRSPQTNSMLRNRSRGVAKHSQHMNGKAMDFYLPDVSPSRVRETGMRLQRGGVGYYPGAHTPFIHLDVGSVRSWPRMSRDQLVRLFPDGRTVHMPSSGSALEGYEVAKADIIARGGSVAGSGSADVDEGAIMQTSRRSLWASLFGGDEEEDARPNRGRRASIASRPVINASTLAYASGNSDDGGSRPGFFPQIQPDVESGAAVMRERSSRIRPVRAPQQEQKTQVAAVSQPVEPPSQVEAKPAAPEPAPLAPKFTTVIAPLPLARPRGLAITPDPAIPGEGFVLASLPNAASDANSPKLVLTPQPPARPGALTSGSIPLASLSAFNAEEPATASSLEKTASLAPIVIRISHPEPPGRPRIDVALASIPTAAKSETLPVAVRPPTEREALQNLFDAVVTPAPSSRTKISTAKATKVTSNDTDSWASSSIPVASFGFSRTTPSDVKTDKFSGPAVRALPTTFVQN
jgi:uncharacterized protein YcbK (DUF882 family)